MATFTQVPAMTDPQALGHAIIELLNAGMYSVEIVDVNGQLYLRSWNGYRADQSNSAQPPSGIF